MSARPLGVGVVGCGEIAQLVHLPLLQDLPELRIAGLCDLSRELVDALGDRYGVALRTEDHAELLVSDEVEAVVVCTYDHAPVVADALAAGRHVLVEKPLAFTAAEAEPLVAAARASGVVAAVGYMRLLDPAVERAREPLAALRGVRSRHVHDLAGRFDRHDELFTRLRGADVPEALLAAGRADAEARVAGALGPERAGHAALHTLLLMLGSHDLSLLRALFGVPTGVAHAQARGDDHLLAVLEHADGVPCVLEVGVGTGTAWWDQWVAVHGEGAQVRLELADPYVPHAPTVLRLREAWGDSPSERVVPVSHESPFRRQWRAFAACVRGEALPRTPLEDGLRDLELAEAITAALPPRRAAA